jgi:chemotaxis protein CheD
VSVFPLRRARPSAASAAPGEAHTFLYEREFDRQAVKLLPGEWFVAAEDIVLVTVLGSCVSACIRDPRKRLGGMNHFMLPGLEARADQGAARGRYGAFAMERLINELIKRGACRDRLEAKVFGGGAVLRQSSTFNVGERNARFVLDFLATEGIRVVAQDLQGVHPRRVAFFPVTGQALCKQLKEGDHALARSERRHNERISAELTGGEVELF